MKRINLLPQNKQTELYYENLFHGVFVANIIATVILLSGIVAQVGTHLYLNQKAQKVQDEVALLKLQVDKGENTEQKQKIKLINSQMLDYQNLADKTPRWSVVLTAFAKLVPDKVKISQFSTDTKTGKVSISGYSPTREKVIELYNNLNSDRDHFRDVTYPLENVAKPTDVQFNYDFFIQDGVLLKKP